MDFLSKAWEQFLELFRSMTPAARVTTGLLMLAVLVSLTYLFRVEGDKADDYLFGAKVLSQREINNMQMAFGRGQLNGWQLDGYRIKVPLGQRAEYLAALHEANAYPEDPGAASDGLFSSITALETRDVRQLKAKRAREKELEAVLIRRTGVEEAFVSIEAADSGRTRRSVESHVLISLRKFGNEYLDASEVKSFRTAGARTAATNMDNVTVFDLNSGLTHGGVGEDDAVAEESLYATTQRTREARFRRKIEDQLKNIPGALVDVFVGLDDNIKMETVSQKFDQPLSVRSNDYTKESTTSTPQFGGRPGPVPNGLGNQSASVVTTDPAEDSTIESRNEVENVAGTTRQVTVRAPLTTESVTATVSLPWSYYKKVWQIKNPEADTEPTPDNLEEIESDEKIRIEGVIMPLLPAVASGEDAYPRVKVATYYDMPTASPPGESVMSGTSAWFASHWQTLATFIVALIGLWMLRGMIRATDSSSVSAERHTLPAEQLTVYTHDDEEDEEDVNESDIANSLKARFQHSGRSLRDELTELVREDPDAAANVLQNWIGDAA